MSKKIEPFPPMSEWSDEALKQLGWSMSEDAKYSEEIMRVRELLEKHKRPKPRLPRPSLRGEPREGGRISEAVPVNLHIKHTSEKLGVTAGKTYKAHVTSAERAEVIFTNDNRETIWKAVTEFFQAEISPFTRP